MIAVELAGVFADSLDDAVIYNNTVTPVTVRGVVDLGTGGNQTDQASILVKKSEVPAPAYRHTFTIGGVEWHVSAGKGKPVVLEEDDTTWLLAISKSERFTQWRK